MVWWLSLALAQPALVVETDGPLEKLPKVLKQAEAMGAEALPVGLGAWCLTFEEAPDARWLAKVEKRLGQAPTERLDCAIARYPMGRGFVVAVIQPHSELTERTADVVAPLSMSVLAESLHGRPATLCVSGMQVDHAALKSDLMAVGLDVSGVYEVGGCNPPVMRRAAAWLNQPGT